MTARATALILAFCLCALASADGGKGLVAHYPLDEGRGTKARDGSKAQRHGRIQGAKWVKREGRTALRFDGGRVACGDARRLKLRDRISVSAWLWPERKSSKKDAVIVGLNPETWALTRYKSRIYFYVSGGGNYVKTDVAGNRWIHVVGTFDGKLLKLYVDGELSASRKPKTLGPVAVEGKFFIGAGDKKRDRYHGLVSDVRVYNRTLGPQEVAMLSQPPDSDLAQVKPTGAQGAAATAFFNKPRETVEFKKSGRQLWLANDKIGVEVLEGKRGFYLSRIYGVETGQDFVWGTPAMMRGGFWNLTLRRDRGRDEAGRTVDSTSGARVTHRVERADGEVVLALKWQGLSVADEKDAVDVDVFVALKPGDPFARWRIKAANRSREWGLWNVTFPIVRLRPLGGDAGANRFVVPRAKGIIADDPFVKPMYSPGSYPGGFNMQFSALYDASGHGLYLATHDGDGYHKAFHQRPLPDSKALEYKVEHTPADPGSAGRDYEMPYDFSIGPFAGDWYDACQIYRAWALKQRWCQQGPIITRKDVPRWYAECPIVLKCSVRADDAWVTTSRDQMLAFLKFIDAEMPLIVYTWKQHFPDKTHYNKEGSRWKVPDKRAFPCGNIHDGNYPALPALDTFSDACKTIAAAGGHVKPYVCSRIYDQGLNENAPLAAQAKPNVVRKLNGDVKFVERGDVGWSMCYYTPWWQDRLAETVTALITREHAGSIYFDTFYGGHKVACFDPRHGHPPPGGNHGYMGARRLSQVVRGAMKRADPQAFMSGENPAETAIDLLDGFLYRYTIRPDDLPLFATVYGDYICRFGIDVKVGGDGFYMQCATLFTEGAQIGRMAVAWADLLKPEHKGTDNEKRMLFLRKLARYYKREVGGKYLAYGQLLRPVTFETPDPMPTSSYKETYKYDWVVTRPSLMSAAFRAPNGDIGVFIVNIAERPLDFSFELAPGKYPIERSRPYHVRSVSEAGIRVPHGDPRKGAITAKGSIPGHDVMLLEVRRMDK